MHLLELLELSGSKNALNLRLNLFFKRSELTLLIISEFEYFSRVRRQQVRTTMRRTS